MLDMREVGVPQHVADTLTIVEHVNQLNYKHLRELVRTPGKTIKYLDMRTIIKGEQNNSNKVGRSKELCAMETLYYSIDNPLYIACQSCVTGQELCPWAKHSGLI